MERDPAICRAYRLRFLAIVAMLSLAGIAAPLLGWFRAAAPALEESHPLDTWAVIWFAPASILVVLSPLAAWYGARSLARRRADGGGHLITAGRPTIAVARMLIGAALLALGWAAPLVPSLWRSVSPGWWTWQDVLTILLVPVLSAATLVLFVHFCGVCNVAARSVAVLRYNPSDVPSDVSPYRFPMAPREVVVVTEHGARTLTLVERAGGEVELASPCIEASRVGPVEAWLVARALVGEA
jgi:hypothetical protein